MTKSKKPDQSNISKQVISSICKALKRETSSDISTKTSLTRDLHAISIDYIEIGNEIEKAMGISLNFFDLFESKPNLKRADISVGDIIEYLEAKQNQGD